MPSLADLFNPSFLMFLGILVLVVALLVVYFESKLREQNHKLTAMFSLVSTLADDLNGVKMGMNYLRSSGETDNNIVQHMDSHLVNKKIVVNDLIEVSDDEEYEEDDSEEEDSEEEDSEEEDSEEEDSEEEDNDDNESHGEQNEELSVLNITDDESNNIKLDLRGLEDIDETLDNLSEEDDEPLDLTKDYVEEVLDLKYDNEFADDIEDNKEEPEDADNAHHNETRRILVIKEDLTVPPPQLKHISVNLGEDENARIETTIDYKKLQLPKLRSIAVEKGVINNSDANKYKKPDLLKLLGVE